MKQIILFVITLIQCTIAIKILHFQPMHAASPISRGKVVGISLGKRQECPFGVVCGRGCTILGPCCDDVTGFSCRDAETCITINGQLGCCPVGTTCTSIKSCLNANDPACVSGTPGDNFFCCDNTAPFCNTSGAAQICQVTISPNPTTDAATTSSAVIKQSSTALQNATVATTAAFVAGSTIESTVVIQNGTSSATQQLIATGVIQSFHPSNTSSIGAASTVALISNLTRSILTSATIAAGTTTVPIISGTSIRGVANSASSGPISSTKSSASTSLGHTLQLNPTRITATPSPLFTGRSIRGCNVNEFTIAMFGFLLGVFLYM